MIRNLALTTLLFTMPFSGMRVICVDSTAPAETGGDCERLCARHHVSGTTGTSNCALSTDDAPLIAFASTAAVAPEQPVPASITTSSLINDAPRSVLEPELAHRVPPPKA